MCHPPYGPGVSEQIESTKLEPEIPVHIMKQYKKWRERITKEFLENPDFWENSGKEEK